MLSERAGVFAVGLEGMMLAGAFAGVLVSHHAGSMGAGLIASALGGVALAALVALAAVRFGADQMVTGLAVNILAARAHQLPAARPRGPWRGADDPRVPLLPPVAIPGVDAIPVIGPILFRQPPLTYLVLLLAPAIWVFLARTRAGLTLRAVGENPAAAFAVGAAPDRVRVARGAGLGRARGHGWRRAQPSAGRDLHRRR